MYLPLTTRLLGIRSVSCSILSNMRWNSLFSDDISISELSRLHMTGPTNATNFSTISRAANQFTHFLMLSPPLVILVRSIINFLSSVSPLKQPIKGMTKCPISVVLPSSLWFTNSDISPPHKVTANSITKATATITRASW